MIYAHPKNIALILILSTLAYVDIISAEVVADVPITTQPNIEHYGLLPEYRSISLSPYGSILPTFSGKESRTILLYVTRKA